MRQPLFVFLDIDAVPDAYVHTVQSLANTLGFNTPFSCCFIYLGFGAGLAVFMFAGFVKTIPLEIEEAATIDGCNPLQHSSMSFAYYLEANVYFCWYSRGLYWVWNDYLLPYLVLDRAIKLSNS